MTTDPIWRDPDWRGPGPGPAPEDAEVCVVGLGGSGLAAVKRLTESNRKVVGIDAGRIAGGAAGANGGFLLAGTSAFFDEATEVLGEERAGEIYAMTESAIGTLVGDRARAGSLRIAGSPRELESCRNHLEGLRAAGFKAEWYVGSEGEGLLIPGDTTYQPVHTARRTTERVLEGGARLHEDTRAVRIKPGFVDTDRGPIRCDHVIVAIDGLLGSVVPELAGRSRSERLQMLATEPVWRTVTTRAVYRRWGMEYYQQLPDGRITLGGFRDAEGDEAWTTSTETTPEVQDSLDELLQGRLGIDAPVRHRWAATVSYTDGILPICEEISPGLAVTGAYNGTGNVIGRLCGEALADQYLGGRSHWLDLLGG
ncbi:MAG: FAD-dependent oxidoreductase [Acidimicrobiia bacterium]|nr:FAD-dependent oxidoreductase [Acidimicrobiia bacterium]